MNVIVASKWKLLCFARQYHREKCDYLRLVVLSLVAGEIYVCENYEFKNIYMVLVLKYLINV